MSDFIKREDVMSLINKSVSCVAPKVGVMDYKHGVITGLNMACDIVEALPPADVAPVRHGRWVTTYRYGFPIWECSECGTQTGTANFPYCFNCGAKMDEEVD